MPDGGKRTVMIGFKGMMQFPQKITVCVDFCKVTGKGIHHHATGGAIAVPGTGWIGTAAPVIAAIPGVVSATAAAFG